MDPAVGAAARTTTEPLDLAILRQWADESTAAAKASGQWPPDLAERDDPEWDLSVPAGRIEHSSQFQAPRWELLATRVSAWLRDNFEGLRGDSQLFEGGPLDETELQLLLWDLDQYCALWRRHALGKGPRPPHLVDYLIPGREDWGLVAKLARESGWMSFDA